MTQDSEVIEKALEPVRQLLLQKSQASAQEQDTERQFTISKTTMANIKQIVKEIDRYDDWNHFVEESLENAVSFWLEPTKMMSLGYNMWPDFTPKMKDEIKKNAPEFYYSMEQATKKYNEITEMIKHISGAKAALSKEKFSVPKNIVLGDAYSLMHQSYNRFFPLKILVTTLALMIKENKTQWIDYATFSEKGIATALEFSDSLKAIKPEGKIAKRNIRISTGLPITHTPSLSMDMNPIERNKVVEEQVVKDEKSKQRFFDCYVGGEPGPLQRFINTAKREKNSSWVFNGALNETGLVHIQNNDGSLEITLSKLGFEFFNIDNPLIDGIKIDPDTGKVRFSLDKKTNTITTTFSNKEIDFIEKKIISRFSLEKIIVKDVLDSMKNKPEVDAKHLDKIVKNTIKKWIMKNKKVAISEKIMTEKDGIFVFDEKKVDSYRIATMGRLAEIGKVNWEIKAKILEDGTSGNAESFYSINK